MKRIWIFVAIMLIGAVAWASTNISIEPLLNNVFDSSANTIKMTIASDGGVNSGVVINNTADTTTSTRFSMTAQSLDTIADANTSRKYLSVSLISGDVVYISLALVGSAVKGDGIIISRDVLSPLGWTMPTTAIYTGGVSATSNTTGTTISVIEY